MSNTDLPSSTHETTADVFDLNGADDDDLLEDDDVLEDEDFVDDEDDDDGLAIEDDDYGLIDDEE